MITNIVVFVIRSSVKSAELRLLGQNLLFVPLLTDLEILLISCDAHYGFDAFFHHVF